MGSLRFKTEACSHLQKTIPILSSDSARKWTMCSTRNVSWTSSREPTHSVADPVPEQDTLTRISTVHSSRSMTQMPMLLQSNVRTVASEATTRHATTPASRPPILIRLILLYLRKSELTSGLIRITTL